jgi:hypothetical protein
MEFTAARTIAPAYSTMKRSMAYSFATYYDADGRELDLPFGPTRPCVSLARSSADRCTVRCIDSRT